MSPRFGYSFFKWVLISLPALQVLERFFEKLRYIQGHVTVAMCTTFESGHVNFIKNVDVCKFSDFDRICILNTTILMNDNFGFLKILWIEGKLNF